ncbi:hypothetical protein PROFUN_02736 [Planoprotostelium fungivorum]|uniref:Uncharacterized protein n=1 Tax=Planoprotostelium fungivorum TaxID=1890364 RepID=A0A2P6NXE7_9EUKA|nr:hypothetical protein PROFUN_02736 [Planoprotostelium fungivorum]
MPHVYHPHNAGATRIRGIIFDMDGTLTVPCIDFKKMRERAKIPQGQDILKYAHSIQNADEKKRCWQAIEEVEAEGRVGMKLQPGLIKLLNYLDAHHIKKSIVTRNSASAIVHMFEVLRDQEKLNVCPSKSFTQLLDRGDIQNLILDSEIIKQTFSHTNPTLNPHCTSVKSGTCLQKSIDDILCGGAAGNVTCLINNEHNGDLSPLAHLNVHSLEQIITQLEEGWSIDSYHQHSDPSKL